MRVHLRGALVSMLAAACGGADPTGEGSAFLVRDIDPGANSSQPRSFNSLERMVVFTAHQRATGTEPWVTDGTAAGTYLLKDIDPRPPAAGGPGSSSPEFLARVGSRVFFAASDAEHGNELWVTDGTPTGTRLVKDINPVAPDLRRGSSHPSFITDVNGVAFFSACDEEHGPEVWRSDGTAGGTWLVSDVYPGPGEVTADTDRQSICLDNDRPTFLTPIGGVVYFAANHPAYGHEVWRTDGTEHGTRLVKDADPGPDPPRVQRALSESARELQNVDGTLFFANRSGVWKSDGTEAGTVLVTHLGASLLASTSRLLFFAGPGGLWRTDGTPPGTLQLGRATLGTSTRFQNRLSDLQAVGDRLYFDAHTAEAGWELWTSDGTPAGTRIVEDIRPGSLDSDPASLTPSGTDLLFTADEGRDARQLWTARGDGGAERLTDVRGGIPDQLPRVPTRYIGTLGDLVFFPGESSAEGKELWALRRRR
jgi:ELWxxDGT repeat protein